MSSEETLDGKLALAFTQERSTYKQVLDDLWAPIYEKVKDEGHKKIADAILSGGTKVVTQLLASALVS